MAYNAAAAPNAMRRIAEAIGAARAAKTHPPRAYQRIEDELDDPRSLALPDWRALVDLANALVARSAGDEPVWGEIVLFAACTAARIGEVSGVRVADIDLAT